MRNTLTPMPALTHPAELVVQARGGDAAALAELYEQHGQGLMALAYRITGSRDDAEDVLHDVFLGLPEALARYDEQGSLPFWLRRVTARVALSLVRARSRKHEEALTTELAAPESRSADRLGDLVAVERAIARLPDSLRLVFVLREVEGYTHAEIAGLLNITPNASEVRLHRAIKALRRTLSGAPQHAR